MICASRQIALPRRSCGRAKLDAVFVFGFMVSGACTSLKDLERAIMLYYKPCFSSLFVLLSLSDNSMYVLVNDLPQTPSFSMCLLHKDYVLSPSKGSPSVSLVFIRELFYG